MDYAVSDIFCSLEHYMLNAIVIDFHMPNITIDYHMLNIIACSRNCTLDFIYAYAVMLINETVTWPEDNTIYVSYGNINQEIWKKILLRTMALLNCRVAVWDDCFSKGYHYFNFRLFIHFKLIIWRVVHSYMSTVFFAYYLKGMIEWNFWNPNWNSASLLKLHLLDLTDSPTFKFCWMTLGTFEALSWANN